jgi:hypothetical protein
VRLAIGVLVWLVFGFAVVSLTAVFPHQQAGWPVIIGGALGAGFAAYCLTDIVRAGRVRHLPKWGWALICLAQIPLGGIVYLCLGRARGARTAPPSPAGRL